MFLIIPSLFAITSVVGIVLLIRKNNMPKHVFYYTLLFVIAGVPSVLHVFAVPLYCVCCCFSVFGVYIVIFFALTVVIALTILRLKKVSTGLKNILKKVVFVAVLSPAVLFVLSRYSSMMHNPYFGVRGLCISINGVDVPVFHLLIVFLYFILMLDSLFLFFKTEYSRGIKWFLILVIATGLLRIWVDSTLLVYSLKHPRHHSYFRDLKY